MFEWAIENQYVLTQNPISKGLTKRVKRFVASSRETTTSDDIGLSLEQMDFFLLESKGKPHEIVMHWQLAHGLRISEALGMMWDDIDFAQDTIQVLRDVSDIARSTLEGTRWAEGEGPIVTGTKTANSRREIPLQARTKALLEQTPAEDRHGYIYATSKGRPVLPSRYRRSVFNPLRKRLDVEWATPHDLRKGFGSVAIINGVDVMTLSHWMGHSNPNITTKIYAKLIPEAEKWHRNTIGTALFRD
jgi:integrase